MAVRRLAPLATLLLILAACDALPGAAKGVDEATRRELEVVLQNRAAGLLTGDQERFQRSIDLARPAFRRCQNELFESAAGAAPFGSGATSVVRLDRFGDAYVRAYVDEGGFGIARRYFRRDGGRWLLSEPTDAEIGAEKTRTVDGLTVEYRAADEDVVETIAREGVATREFLRPLAPRPSALGFRLRLYPTAESVGVTQGCFAVISVGERDDPYLRLYSFWLAPSLKEVSDDTRRNFRREGLRWVQKEYVPGFTARVLHASWWAAEGWLTNALDAEEVPGILRATLCRGQIFDLAQLSEGPTPDIQFFGPQVGAVLYAEAGSMVEYAIATYGARAYWDFLAAHADTLDPKVLYPKAFGVSGERFFAEWQAWAKKKVC